MVTVNVLHANEANDIKGDYVRLLQVFKPHTKEITVMSLNSANDLLVTGSKDCTIFVFLIEKSSTYPSLIPIGFIKTPSGITCLNWKVEFVSLLSNHIFVVFFVPVTKYFFFLANKTSSWLFRRSFHGSDVTK